MTVTKARLAEALFEEVGFNKREAKELIDQFFEEIRASLEQGEAVKVSGFGSFLALPRVLPVFEANPYLNGFIIFVFGIGVLACFYQVFQLIGSVRWIERFATDTLDSSIKAPQLLAPLASLLRQRGAGCSDCG